MSALNGLFRFLGWEGCRARFVKVQRRLFRDPARELTRPDYERLIATARELGKERLALVMETICATGVRVSELRYLTVEACLLYTSLDDKPFSLCITEGIGGAAGAAIAVRNAIAGLVDHISVCLLYTSPVLRKEHQPAAGH